MNYIHPLWFYQKSHGFIKNLWQIHLRDSHVKFMGKIRVGNTTWAKLIGLIGQKRQNSFSKLTRKISLSVWCKQASRQASTWLFSDFHMLSSFLGCYFSGISCTFHFGQKFDGFLASTFDFCWSLPLQFFRRQVSFCSS